MHTTAEYDVRDFNQVLGVSLTVQMATAVIFWLLVVVAEEGMGMESSKLELRGLSSRQAMAPSSLLGYNFFVAALNFVFYLPSTMILCSPCTQTSNTGIGTMACCLPLSSRILSIALSISLLGTMMMLMIPVGTQHTR